MARYIGPDCRICRRQGEKLMLKGARCFSPKCAFERRPKAPGQQGTQRRRRLSDRGLQLREKQKARHIYGILERQFKKTFRLAAKKTGVTGDTLLVLLERRLDNVVYRLGFADSRAQARQLVRHGHILLNGRRTDIPSALVKEGDTITWREGSRRTKYYAQIAQSIEAKQVPNWLSLDRQTLTGKVISLPTPDQVDASFDTKLIIEYYSR